jgi:anti-sigma-K factor RskA
MSSREPDLDCAQSIDAAPHVLGALEERESRSYREHLQSCARCRAQVAELQGVVDELPTSAPPVVASPALRERILASVRAEAELLHAAGHQADRPPKPASRWRSRPFSFVAGGVALAGTAAVAAVIALSVGSAPSEHVTPAKVASTLQGAEASLHRTGERGDLVVSGMPAPPLGRIYEVWLKRGARAPAQPTDALFGVTNQGSAAVHVPNSLHGVSEVLVTDEPAGGSAHPTTQPLLTVALPA